MKKTLTVIFLFQFLIFLGANQALGQDECTLAKDGKIKLYYCNRYTSSSQYERAMPGSFDASMGRQGSWKTSTSSVRVPYFSLDSGENKLYLNRKNLAPFVKGCLEAEVLLQKHKSLSIARDVTRWGGLGAGLFLTLTGYSGAEYTQMYVGLGLVLASQVVGIFVLAPKANDALYDAVGAYNNAQSPKTSFLQPLKPDYFKIGNAQGTAGITIGWNLGTN